MNIEKPLKSQPNDIGNVKDKDVTLKDREETFDTDKVLENLKFFNNFQQKFPIENVEVTSPAPDQV